jgi:hypothetical protein
LSNFWGIDDGGGSQTPIEPTTQRVHEYFMEKHGRKPTVDEFLNFDEPLRARIEPETKWVEFEKNLIELVDREYFVFCRWCEGNREVVEELVRTI